MKLPARIALPLLLLALGACSEEATPPDPPGQVPKVVVSWLRSRAIPFNTSQAGGPYQDLLPVKALVGDARIVSLGEATHGTREFFEMKHRMLEFLVREMGFDVFAIEAEWAEANRINEYVLTGRGNPHTRLTGLYFWTWRTQEVLDLIEWMRRYNADPANPRKVSFVGVDAQFPTLAMDTTLAYLRRVDPGGAALAAERYACFRPYSNNSRGSSALDYSTLPAQQQQECRARVQSVHDYLTTSRARLEAASSPAEHAFALQAARLAVQGEDVRSRRDSWSRDRYMAENVGWWLNRAGTGSKMVIWAHNAHVSTAPEWMGKHLRERFGQGVRIFGFSFYEGSFTAVNLDGGPLGPYTLGPAPVGSYEHFFHAAGLPRFILDLRVSTATPATGWLAGPRLVQEVGCCHRPSVANWGVKTVSLPSLYDAVIHFESTTASRLLPAVWE